MSDTYTKYQKVIKVGNSYAVTLDRDFVKKNALVLSEPIAATYQTDGSVVSFSHTKSSANASSKRTENEKKARRASTVTPELAAWVERSLTEDAEAMEALANL